MDKLCYIFLYFVFYSMIGYVCEVFYVYLGDKKWVNRGFLHGPYIPIYGNGAMIVTITLLVLGIVLIFNISIVDLFNKIKPSIEKMWQKPEKDEGEKENA